MRIKLASKNVGTIWRALWKREARVLEGGVYALAVFPAWVGLPTDGPLHHWALADLIVAAVVAANVFASSHAGFGASKAVAIRAMALLMISAPCAFIVYVAAFNGMIAKADPNLASIASAVGLGVEILRGALVVLLASFVLFVSLTWHRFIESNGRSDFAGRPADPTDAVANNDPVGASPDQQRKPGEPLPRGSQSPQAEGATAGTCMGAKLKKPRTTPSAPRPPTGRQSETKHAGDNRTAANAHSVDATAHCSGGLVVKTDGRTDEFITEPPQVSNGVPFGSAGVAGTHRPEQILPTGSSPGLKTVVGPACRTGDGLQDGRKRAKWPAIWGGGLLIALAMTGEAYTLWSMPKHAQPNALCDAPRVPPPAAGGVTYQAPSGGQPPSPTSSSRDIVDLKSTFIAPAFGGTPELPGVAPTRTSDAADGSIRAPPAKAPKRQ